LHEIATLLVRRFSNERKHSRWRPSQNTHLNRQQLSYCVSLIENGVNPDALAVSNWFGLELPFLKLKVVVC
jgi:mitotic-spindle organizing protein 1